MPKETTPHSSVSLPGIVLLVLALTTATVVRNTVYHSEITLWESAVRSTPGKQRTHHNLACALANAGRYRDALRAIDDALRLKNDGSILLHYLLIEQGNDYYHLGERRKALRSWRRALTLSPGNAEIMTNMAVVLLELGRREEAQAYARSALDVPEPLAETLEVMGEIALQQKEYDNASSFFAAAVRRKPELRSAYRSAALAREGAGDYQSAYGYLQKYLAMDLTAQERTDAETLRRRLLAGMSAPPRPPSRLLQR